MASGRRSSTPLNIKVFLLSGFDINRRKELGRKIESLGGKYLDIKHFNAGCTHVICDSLSRSEKFLGACATGKWMLHASYVEDSCVAECWLDEEQYEWCDDHIFRRTFNLDYNLAVASRRWRFLLGGATLAFSGWKVAVVTSQGKSMAIKRLLSCGGADIYDLKMPIKNPGRVANMIAYIFVSANMMHLVAHLIDYGILLVKPEFIADFLIKDPQPDQMDYLVQCTDASNISMNSEPLDEDSFLMSSQRSMYISPTKNDITDDERNTPGSSRHSSPGPRSNLFPSLRSTELPSTSRRALINAPSLSDRLTSSPISLITPTKDEELTMPSRVAMSPIVIKSEKMSPVKKSSSSFFTTAASSPSTSSAAAISSSQNITGSSTLSLIEDVIDLTGTDDEDEQVQATADAKKGQSDCSTSKSKDDHHSNGATAHKPTDKTCKVGLTEHSVKAKTDSVIETKGCNASYHLPKTGKVGLTDNSNKTNGNNTGQHSLKSCKVDLNNSSIKSNINNSSYDSLKECKVVLNNTSVQTNKGIAGHHSSKKTKVGSNDSSIKTNIHNAGNQSPMSCKVSTTDSSKETNISKVNLSQQSQKTSKRNQPTISSMFDKQNEQKRKESPLTTFSGYTMPNKQRERVDSPLSASFSNNSSSSEQMTSVSSSLTSLSDSAKHIEQKRRDSPLASCSDYTLPNRQRERVDSPLLASISNNSTPSKQLTSINSQLTSLSNSANHIEQKRRDSPLASVHNNATPTKQITGVSSQLNSFLNSSTPDKQTAGIKSQVASSSGSVNQNKQKKSEIVGQTNSSTSLKPKTDKHPDSSNDRNIFDDVAMDTSPAAQTPSTPGITSNRNKRKRKSVDDLHDILLDVKRRKIGHCEWLTSDTVCTSGGNKSDSNPLQTASTEMIHTIFEDDKDTSTGLWYLETHLSQDTYIQPATVSTLINNIILSSNRKTDVIRAYYILSQMLVLHPPVNNVMQTVYLQCISCSTNWEDRQVGAEWDFISKCISSAMTNDEANSGNRLMFKFIVKMLQANMHQFLIDPEMRADVKNKNLLVRIIWCPSYHVVFNQRCRQLLDFMSEIIQQCKKITDSQDKVCMYEILDDILWMVAMVTECCRIQGNEDQDVITALLCDNISVFVNEIAKRLIELNIKDTVLLQRIFQSLRLPWLRIGICQIMLNKLDDYLVTIEGDNRLINLLSIVSRYFFLLPQFDSVHGPLVMSSPARVRTLKSRNTPTVPTNRKVKSTDKENIDKVYNKINKRNHKGETQLHVACRRNNIATVKKLLAVPGIDVNIPDNDGWTALHEACNHGSLECVKELLKYVPAKTIDRFFQKDDICKKVNLLAVNTEGITPLHDAVLCGHLDVCEVLLQHGGRTLLSQKTMLNYTPLDLCEPMSEIYDLLKSYDNDHRNSSDSRISNSQESNSSSDNNEPVIPCDSSYHNILNVDGRKVYSNPTKLSLYVCLVKILLKNYITARNLFSVVEKVNKNKGKSLCKKNGDHCDTNSITSLDGQICSHNGTEDEKHSNKAQNEAVPGMDGFKEPKVHEKEITDLRDELGILRKFQFYVDCFQNHLKKISKEDLHSKIEQDVLELYFLVDELT